MYVGHVAVAVVLVASGLHNLFNSFNYFSLVNLIKHLYYGCKMQRMTLSIVKEKPTNIRQLNMMSLSLLLSWLLLVSVFRFSASSTSALSVLKACPLLVPSLCPYYVNVVALFFNFYNISLN